MKTHTAEFRANRLAFRFRKSGADGRYARQFVSFDESTQAKLAQLAELDGREVPAVACYFDDEAWVVITSERVICCSKGQRTALSLYDIVEVAIDEEGIALAGTKAGLCELTLVTKGGGHCQLRLEPGEPFSGFWNALKMVEAWNI